VIIDSLLFLLGIHLSMMVLAALYSMLDLGYARRRYRALIAKRIGAATALFVAVVWVLGGDRGPFVWGAAGFAVFHTLKCLTAPALMLAIYRYRRRRSVGAEARTVGRQVRVG